MSIIIGLTGPTGAGKSSAAAVCEKHSVKTVDCDRLARVAVQKGSDGLKALTLAFGKEILSGDGSLNRKKLASIAFKSPDNTKLLNQTIFPFIRELVFKETAYGRVLLDAPTLFESGINEICFKTVAVLSDSEKRLKRIMTRDNLSESEAKLRMSAGKNDDFYKKNADYIIYNNESADTFIKEFDAVLTEILALGEDL